MDSLYGRLFKYRSREARSPLEDYLSECFADFFNRLDLKSKKQLAKRLFIPTSLHVEWDHFAFSVEELNIETQYPISAGRIDLILSADGVPFIAVENKVSAPIGKRADGEDQLSAYGKWIRSVRPSIFVPIVCLLTHTTKPRDAFLKGGDASGRATPHVVRWSAIGTALAIFRRVDSDASDEVKMLAAELFRFLGEQNMSNEFAGRDEFSAAIVYLRAGARMDHTFSSIYLHLKTLKGQFSTNESPHEMSLHYSTKDSLIWGWKYLIHPTLNGLFFGYGISLDPAPTFRNASVPKYDAAFICVGAEDKRSIQSMRAVKDVPTKPWMYSDLGEWSAVISFKPLHQWMSEPETFSARMIEWIDSEADNVNEFVRELK